MNVEGEIIEIFFTDLKEDVQEKLLELWDGDNGNYDVIPMFELPIRAILDQE